MNRDPAPNTDPATALSLRETLQALENASRIDPTRPIAEELLREILTLASRAPSTYNLQPWRFLVVREADNRRLLARHAFNHPMIARSPIVIIVLGFLHPHRSHLEMILAAHREAAGLTDREINEIRGRSTAMMDHRADPSLWTIRAAMAAATALTIAARSLGVGSCTIDFFDAPGIRESFGVPDDHAICCLIALGHEAEPTASPERLPLDELCNEEHFGQPPGWSE